MGKTKMSSEREQNLRALAKLMNKQNVRPVPITKALLDCFEMAITPEENAFLLRMGREPHTYEEAASLSNLPEESFRPFFETQLEKGLIWPERTKEGEERFTLSPIFVGWFELYLSDGKETPDKKEFAHGVDRYFKSFKKINFFPLRNFLNYQCQRKSKSLQTIAAIKQPNETKKTVSIHVDRKLEVPATKVFPAKSVFELIEKYGDSNKIALVHCFCRQWRKMVNEPCRFDLPSEACIVIGDMTKYIVDYGIGRYISKEKALEIIQEVEEKGAVHQVFYEKEDINQPEIAICNCCWDCCGILGSYNRGILPLRLKSYYCSEISDDSLCLGCGACEKYCPVNAISLVDEKANIDTQKCIGCGQCALQCPEDAITLIFREREVILPLQKKSRARIAA